jgi:putative transposase
MRLVRCFWILIRAFFVSRASLGLEFLSLRQQLAILKRKKPKPKLKKLDRMFWVVLSKLWTGWRSALMIVQPSTVIRWHRQGFKLFWKWKSRGRAERPRIDTEIRRLIRQLSKENPMWGRSANQI